MAPKTVLQCLIEAKWSLGIIMGLFFLFNLFVRGMPLISAIFSEILFLVFISIWYYIRENYLNKSAG